MSLFSRMQSLGKALMLPVAVLPVAGLMLRLGAPDVMNIGFMEAAGASIFSNLPMIFAVGIACGLSKENAGAGALAGLIGFLVLTTTAKNIDDSIDMGVLSGILSGVIAGIIYNRFYTIKLPDYLGFFSGKRFVPILTGLCCLILGALIGAVWPPIQHGIETAGQWIIETGPFGTFTFGFLHRMLIPFGLHHILNGLIWFMLGSFEGANGVVNGDMARFFAGDPTAGGFMVGLFPVMLFGLPAACLAFIHTAKPENRKAITGAMISVALTSFLTGITEPVEFLFLFVAPLLYLVHAILTGISFVILDLLAVKHGFTFSAGAIDFVLNFGLATKPMLVIVIGVIYGVIYYALFRFVIQKFDLKTPGREGDPSEAVSATSATSADETGLAPQYVQALGGGANIISLDSCITRLRVDLKDANLVDKAKCMTLGATGVLKVGNNSVQVIVGTHADNIAEQIKQQLMQDPASTETLVTRVANSNVDEHPGTQADQLQYEDSETQAILQALGGADNVQQQFGVIAKSRVAIRLRDCSVISRLALISAGVKGLYAKADMVHLIVGRARADALAAALAASLSR